MSDVDSGFVDELRSWLDQVALPQGLRDWGLTAGTQDLVAARAWQRLLFEAGWAGLGWPTDFGGAGASPLEEAAFIEELSARGLPRQISVGGPDVAGPMIMRFGNSGQKALLPDILSGEHIWCQLWSEPDAGSDLANVRTRAERVDDGWCVTGHKVWASAAQIADHALLLARTGLDDPPQAGLTMFVLPMDREGITLRPIAQMDGEAKFNEVFLDGVRIGPDEVLGSVDEGWRVLGSAVGRERLTIGAQAASLIRTIHDLVDDARRRRQAIDGILQDRVIRLWVRGTVLRWTFRRLIATTDGLSDPRLSLLKVLSTELLQDVSLLAGDVWGMGLVAGECDSAAHRLLAARGATIAGGSSEIQRNIIAERVLALPREPHWKERGDE